MFQQYIVMPFGLRRVPATFHRLKPIMLCEVPNCQVHLDDMVIHSDTWEEHHGLMRYVPSQWYNVSLILNLQKWKFGKCVIIYLGTIVRNGTVKSNDAKVQASSAFPVPKTKWNQRRSHGMVRCCWCFFNNYLDVIVPFTNLFQQNFSFVWFPMCQVAFELFKFICPCDCHTLFL